MNTFHWILIGLTVLLSAAAYFGEPKKERDRQSMFLSSAFIVIYVSLIILSAKF